MSKEVLGAYWKRVGRLWGDLGQLGGVFGCHDATDSVLRASSSVLRAFLKRRKNVLSAWYTPCVNRQNRQKHVKRRLTITNNVFKIINSRFENVKIPVKILKNVLTIAPN